MAKQICLSAKNWAKKNNYLNSITNQSKIILSIFWMNHPIFFFAKNLSKLQPNFWSILGH